ncbi:MAG: class I SAM-dependent methyltransferase [Candidatus Nanopelagicales bacterium]
MTAGSGSYRDPENAAVALGDRWYRVAGPASAGALSRLRDSEVYESLVADGSLVRFEESAPDTAHKVLEAHARNGGRSAPGGSRVFDVESVGSITYPWEWPDALLRSAGLHTLDVRDRLLAVGLDLKDASAFNVQFRGMQPVFMDVGSVEEWRPNPSWNATRQYVEHFINPLAVGSGKTLTAADAWELSRRKGLRSDVARAMMPRRQRWRPSLWVLQASTRPVAGHAPVETKYAEQARQHPERALRATRSLTGRLRKQTVAVSGGSHSSTWSDYGDRAHYTSEELLRKLELSVEFVNEDARSGLVLDIGGNDGLVAAELVEKADATVLVLDPDAGALDVLSQRIAGEPALRRRITPVQADVTNLTPASGLLDTEFAAFTQRMAPTAVLCQAVLHHIVITQGVPMRLAVQALARFRAPLLVEFATDEDDKAALLLRQIPNWSGDYSTPALLEALEVHFHDVAVVGRTSSTRVVVSTGRPRSG